MSLLGRRCLNAGSYLVCVMRRESNCAELCESRLGTKTKTEVSSLEGRVDSWKQKLGYHLVIAFILLRTSVKVRLEGRHRLGILIRKSFSRDASDNSILRLNDWHF